MAQNSIQEKKKDYYEHDRSEMLKYVPYNSKLLLEVGCGSGIFAKLVKDTLECEYWGIEINEEARASAKYKLDYLIDEPLEECKELLDKKFDCIIFNDVLEHLTDPIGTLSFCKNLLSENGVVVSSIPNLRHIPYLYRLVYKGEFDYAQSGIMDYTHYHLFTKKSIISLYKKAGYKIIINEGINISIPRKFILIFRLLSFFRINKFEDTKFQQFATVAR